MLEAWVSRIVARKMQLIRKLISFLPVEPQVWEPIKEERDVVFRVAL
jgi:hypothetical protein